MSHSSKSHVDTVVVGAGVIGLSVALELQRRGRSTVVLERGSRPSGASTVAGGMLAPISEADTQDAALVGLGRESLERYPEFARFVERQSGFDCRYRTNGTLWVAVHRDEQEELRHLAETLRQKQLQVEALDPSEVLAREPHLSHRVLSGLLVADDHQLDPQALLQGLESSLRQQGGLVAYGRNVVELGPDPGSGMLVSGIGPGGGAFQLRADQIVVAAGAWCRPEWLGGESPALRPVKGQLVRLHGDPLVQHVVRTPDVYLIPRDDGELIVGATTEEMGFAETPTAGAVMDLLRHAWQVLPGSYELEFSSVSVGLRSALDDHLPLIDQVDPRGIFVAVGHYRNGVLLAPATAHYLAEWITSGKAPQALAPFSQKRFLPGSPRVDPAAPARREAQHDP